MEDVSKFLPPTTLSFTTGQIRGLRPFIKVDYMLKNGETGVVGCRAEYRRTGWVVVFVPRESPDNVKFNPTDDEMLAAVNGRKPLIYREV